MPTLHLPDALPALVIRWYAAHARARPWRSVTGSTADPYRVWLSEIMLQQTRIETVIPYYFRFLEACPTVEALAAIDDDRLIKLWEGLGYYSRARNLKKAAQVIAREYGGALPPDVGLLRALPGIGEYTAGAVASIAFGLPEPAVDGNVLRVVSRIAALPDDVALPQTKRCVTEALRRIYPGGMDAACFTEGLMELGEVVCLPPPAEPHCDACPLKDLCEAQRTGETDRYPVKSPKKERRVEEWTVLLLRLDGKLALRRRGEGLLGGMWEFPNVPGSLGEDEVPAAVRTLCPEAEIVTVGQMPSAKHVFTHVEWRMRAYLVDVCGSVPFETAAPEEIREKYALPTAFRKWKLPGE